MQNGKLSKEEYKRQQDLEAARKAGTAPPAVDEEGNEINPHIPQYIVQAPWYISTGAPTLKHQRTPGDQHNRLDSWYSRGLRTGPAATKFRKGACMNCGAMSHKTKECMERPRKLGARWTNKDICPDEHIQKIDLGFEAKRDRWNGYDPSEFMDQLKEWELVDEQRKRIRADKLDQDSQVKAALGNEILAEVDTSSGEEEEDEDKYADNADMAGQHLDTKSRQTVRNLRIREDIPKYLRNLDPNSAHYDPKTRSMRENPNKDKNVDELEYAGDAAFRFTGDSNVVTDTMLFSLQAAEHGSNIHANANPSQAEFLYREYLKKKDEIKDQKRSSILDKYGGAAHLVKPPIELLQQNEEYIEYSRTGRVIKGTERAVMKSKYPEDQFVNNHTSVWGSYWSNHTWGYACCHNTLLNSYCTGAAGRDAVALANQFLVGQSAPPGDPKLSLVDLVKDSASSKPARNSQKRKLGDGNDLVPDKLVNALARERRRQMNPFVTASSGAKFMDSTELTEEDLEAHRILRVRSDDPMANWDRNLNS